MANEPTQYKPDDILTTVRDRIRDTYASLIPEEMWTTMIKKEIDTFFNITQSSYSLQVTPFAAVVRNELEKHARAKLSELISNLGDQVWTDKGYMPAEELKRLCIDHAGEILAGMMGNAFSNTLRQMQQHL